MSNIQFTILKRLWINDSEDFPKAWVASSELLQLTGQKYFDRRVREIREKLGCDIEAKYKQELSGHAYRLTSECLSPPQNRDCLSEKQKQTLFDTVAWILRSL